MFHLSFLSEHIWLQFSHVWKSVKSAQFLRWLHESAGNMGVRNKSQFFSLPDLFFLQSAVQIIEDRALGLTPQRSDQQIFRSVSGKTVDDKVRAQDSASPV